MKAEKRDRLEKAGWRFGTAADFLELSEEDVAYIELKLALSSALKKTRLRKQLTQVALAELVESSQSRIAKREAGDPTVSIDLIVRSLLALGVSRKEIAKTLSMG